MKQAACETFVVRIYRRDPVDPGQLTGTVESAEHGSRASFDSLDSLMAAISGKPPDAGSRRRPPDRMSPTKGR